jgi:hypothetical protein
MPLGAWLTGNQNPLGPIDAYIPDDQHSSARQSLQLTGGIEGSKARSPRTAILIMGVIVLVLSVAVVLASVFVDPFG